MVLLSANAIYMSEHEQRICEPSRWWLWKLRWQARAAPQRPEVLEDFGGMIFTLLSLFLEGRQSLYCPTPTKLLSKALLSTYLFMHLISLLETQSCYVS